MLNFSKKWINEDYENLRITTNIKTLLMQKNVKVFLVQILSIEFQSLFCFFRETFTSLIL